MAREVEVFPVPVVGRPQYDWDNWLNGKVWELKETEDFVVVPPSFRNTARAAASRKGLGLRTTINGGTIYIQAYKEGEDEDGKETSS